jgi:signal transduction histidine kinase
MTTTEREVGNERREQSLTADTQIRLLFVVMVIIGFFATFLLRPGQGLPSLTSWEILIGVALGLIYLLVGLNQPRLCERLSTNLAGASFFFLQCALLLGIGLILGTGGSWLMGIPLVGFAVEMLPSRRRWPVYIAVVACTVLPMGIRQGSWASALVSSATVSTAVVFVALFAQMRLNEQQARERAEQLMTALEKANEQLASYATQAEELAMTQERNRLAREIHDSLGHTLTIVNVQIEAAKAVMETDPNRALDAISKVQDLAQQGLTQVRESVAALRESPVRDRPLEEAIRPLIGEVESSGIIAEFQVTGEPQALEHKVALALYRAAQEGLTNVFRHARASRVDVLLDFRPDEVCLEVKDNGVGSAQTGGGFGLLGIRERMQLLGGSLEVHTKVGKEFSLMVRVPFSSTSRISQPKG